MRKALTSQDILTLKEKIPWKGRLRVIVDLLKEEEERELMRDKLKQMEAGNVSELNNLLTKLKFPFLEVSDLVKNNHLTLLTTDFVLKPVYPLKAINLGGEQRFYRISIMGKFSIEIDEKGTEFYLLPCLDNE